MSKKILLSGVKPTGRAHIGNYFGAMKQWVELLNSGNYDCFLAVVDYHALNFIQNREEMKDAIYNLTLDFLAIGLDPEKAIIFKQSDISAHTELTWIFDTLVTVPYLQRAHAFKDAEAKDKEVSMGTFNYPVLMAADILLYNSDIVPVGQDQKQHIEYARDIAQKFNNTFGETFKLPEPMILDHVAIVPGTDGKKMSKSYNNTIPLFASRKEIEQAVMSIVTDSSNATNFPKNIYDIHKLFRKDFSVQSNGTPYKYKQLKEDLIEDIDAFIKPLREKRAELAKNSNLVNEVLEKGALEANKRAQAKLKEVKEKIGVLG